jgi:hypothetical protein
VPRRPGRRAAGGALAPIVPGDDGRSQETFALRNVRCPLFRAFPRL